MVSQEEADVPTYILVTGATGFLGKVVLEELLRQKTMLQITKIIIMIRSKRGQNASGRFMKELAPSPCFSKLPDGWTHHVEVIEGDLKISDCGLNKIDYENICSRVTYIIHCAGSIKFDLPLAEAATSNVNSILNIHDLAKDCPKLQRLVVTSTAYVTPYTPEPIFEVFPPLPRPASQIFEGIQNGKLDEKQLLRDTGHPNTYTLTKCIAEHLISERGGRIPVTIVRPSIVSASLRYPYPGWIDSFATLSAFVIAFGSGLMRVFDANLMAVVDVVPVDAVAQKLILEAFSLTGHKSETKIVYAVATVKHGTEVNVVKESIMEFSKSKSEQPAAKLSYCGPRSWTFYFHDFWQHRIRFFFASLYYTCRGDKTRREQVKRGAKMVSTINHLFPHFIHNTFDFRPQEGLLRDFDAKEYMSLVCSGVERHLTSKNL